MDQGEIVILEEVSVASQTEVREIARIVHEGCCAVSFGPREDGLQLASACSSGHIRCIVRPTPHELAFPKGLHVGSAIVVISMGSDSLSQYAVLTASTSVMCCGNCDCQSYPNFAPNRLARAGRVPNFDHLLFVIEGFSDGNHPHCCVMIHTG